jgi:hypothetical protein
VKIPSILPEHSVSCHGPCQQGRLPCPTPAACEQPEPDLVRVVLNDAVIAVLVLALIGALVLAALGRLW